MTSAHNAYLLMHSHGENRAALRAMAEKEIVLNPGNWYAGDVILFLDKIAQMDADREALANHWHRVGDS